MNTITKTIAVVKIVSFLVGQVTLLTSCLTSFKNFNGAVLAIIIFFLLYWQERRDSNPQPPVLETGALPIELRSYISYIISFYSIILDTTPAPTVLPPSLIANLKPSSIAIGAPKFTSNCILSPGITISVPLGSAIVPVTSVVLK